MQAASRRAERDSQRRYRQLQRTVKEQTKQEALQQASFQVELFENRLERLTSVHKEAPDLWDWNSIYNTPPPVPPDRSSAHEAAAAAALEAFKPMRGQTVEKVHWRSPWCLRFRVLAQRHCLVFHSSICGGWSWHPSACPGAVFRRSASVTVSFFPGLPTVHLRPSTRGAQRAAVGRRGSIRVQHGRVSRV